MDGTGRSGKFCPAPCLGPQDLESLGELKTVQKGLEKILLPILLVPLVRSYQHGERAEGVPLRPQLLPAQPSRHLPPRDRGQLTVGIKGKLVGVCFPSLLSSEDPSLFCKCASLPQAKLCVS